MASKSPLPQRPALDESAWTRAKTDAKAVSLDTFLGLVVTSGLGALGGTFGAQIDASGVLEAVLIVAGTVVGALGGIAIFLGWHYLFAARDQRDELRAYLQARVEGEQGVAAFKARCFKWADDVQRLYDAQAAKEPPSTQDMMDVLRGQREAAPARTERERIQRETVSLYIEKYRDAGVRLFDIPDLRARLPTPYRGAPAGPLRARKPVSLISPVDGLPYPRQDPPHPATQGPSRS